MTCTIPTQYTCGWAGFNSYSNFPDQWSINEETLAWGALTIFTEPISHDFGECFPTSIQINGSYYSNYPPTTLTLNIYDGLGNIVGSGGLNTPITLTYMGSSTILHISQYPTISYEDWNGSRYISLMLSSIEWVSGVPPTPKQLIIEDSSGNIVHTKSLEGLTTGTYKIPYSVDAQTWVGKLKIYTTGMYPSLSKIMNVSCIGNGEVVECDEYLGNVVLYNSSSTYTDTSAILLTNQLASDFCTSKFTIDGYIIPTNIGSSTKYFWNISPSDFPNYIYFALGNTGILEVYLNGTSIASNLSTLVNNIEYHIELDVDGIYANLYVNGVLARSTDTMSTTPRVGAVTIYYNRVFNLNFANSILAGTQNYFRVTKLVNRHTTNFTPPSTTPILEYCYAQTNCDPYWDNVALAMHMDSSPFICEKGSTFTNYGATLQTIAKFNSGMNGGTGYLTLTNPINLLSTNNWTIECFVKDTGNNNSLYIEAYNNAITVVHCGKYLFAQKVRNGADNPILTTSAINFNDYIHIAIVYSVGTLKVFANGLPVGSASILVSFSFGEIAGSGGLNFGSNQGMLIDDLRITNGIARYTGNFIPPTRSFPTIGCTTGPITRTIVTKYQELTWSVGQPTMNLAQDLNWVIGPNSYNLATNLNWSTNPIQLVTQELNWGTRPNLERNIDIYYIISPTLEQDLAWVISPQIGEALTWSIGNIVRQDVNWSIANIIRPQISWSVTNNSVVADLNWSIRQWNPQDISWEVE